MAFDVALIPMEVVGDESIPMRLDMAFTLTEGGGGTINNQNKTVTPSLATQQITADSGYTGLGTVTVNPMPSGHIDEVGTLKSVSNHTATITPYVVIDESGYIADGEVQGASETVTANELVSGSETKTANGTYDVTNLASVVVDVDNSYTASDEGKVVSNGALVAQGSQTITENGTYDTTLVDDVTVNVSGGSDPNDTESFFNKTWTGDLSWDGTSLNWIVLNGQAGITSLSFPNATLTSASNTSLYAFADMPNLQSFSAPKITRVANYFFRNDSNLQSVNVDSLGDAGQGTFYSCTSLRTVKMPKCSVVYADVFRNCTSLQSFDVLATNGITNQNNFNGCTNFTTLIIRKTNGVATLGNINNFSNTPFASGGTGGTLYVPQALISSYESATNWSTILGYANNQILPIEGSIYETQYADGTPIS